MKKLKLLFLYFLIVSAPCFAQKESNVWYFGRDGVGLDFNCIPPSVVTGHAMIGWEGVATVSDRNSGKVLFYTNGDRIFGRNHVLLPDGSNITPLGAGFEPLNTLTQVLPIPVPENPNQYFVVASDAQGGKLSVFDSSQNGVWAVKIDMTLNNGLGAVVERFQIHNPLFATEKLMAVPHSNGNDYFLIGHDFDTNRFFISKVDAAGIQVPPTFQTIGSVHSSNPSDTDNLNAIGELKASPDGTMLASVISLDGKIELFDFDASTGTISNARELGTEPEVFGLSFSPDNSKLYVGTWTGKLIQYNLAAGNTNDIIASKSILYEYAGGSFGSLKIAPDGKIYVSRFQGGGFAQDGGDTFLGIINAPNEIGTVANYEHDGIDLEGRKCNWGLNNLIEQNSFEQIDLSVDLGEDRVGDCGDPPFILDAENDCAEYFWQDGSMASTFEVTQAGTYFVDVVYGNCLVSDTMTYEVDADLEFSLGENQLLCLGENITLDASIAGGTYLWQDGSTLPTFTVMSPGIYAVTVTNSCGTATDEIEITSGGNAFLFKDIQIPNAFTPDGDGVNDVFKPVVPEALLEEFTDVEFVVFNRWGEKVFSSENITTGWDGKQNGQSSTSDVFVWFLKARGGSCGGELVEYFEQGDVTLIR